MRAGYGESLRGFFANKTNPCKLIDLSGVKVFENATVDVNILILKKESNSYNTAACKIENLAGAKNLSDFFQQNATLCNFLTSDSWIILSPIEQSIKKKIEAVGTPLKRWNIQINYGIKTGLNEAFVITTEQRNEILAQCKSNKERRKTDELIRPILRGRDIKRYGYDWAGLWLINVHNGIKGKLARIDIQDYPAIKAHLDKYWAKIQPRADQGDTPYNLRNCAYMEDFNKPKVIWKIIGCNINFAFDDQNMLCNNAVDIMTGEKNELLQFVGIMNSKLFDWYLKLTTEAEVQGGGIQLYVTTLEKCLVKLNFPKKLSEAIERRTKGLVTDDYIDGLICDAYRLSDEEKKYILRM
jgi:hypothetical protein